MYKAILFSVDGDWVTDYYDCKTIEEVEEYLANRGSRWYFFPFEFVIKDKGNTDKSQRVLSVPYELQHLKGKSIKTVIDYIIENGEALLS